MARSITAFAPASVGNVGVGFDVLGHALDAVGDAVTLTLGGAGVTLGTVGGRLTELPRNPARNTATRPLEAIRGEFRITDGVRVDLEKGVPLGSGMGGSAASAVAAVVAADALWDLGLDTGTMLRYALQGEAAASGATHPDNAAPSLLGGLVLCETGDPPVATRLHVPPGLCCVLLHPELVVETRGARELLSREITLEDYVRQSSLLAGFVAGCITGDLAQVERCLKDLVIEPQRRHLIPGFSAVQAAALERGAVGCSISGSGPSVFAWCLEGDATNVQHGMEEAFGAAGVAVEAWVSAIDCPGARVVDASA